MRPGAGVLRLERARQRGHCLLVGALDERPLSAFHLEESPEILRVENELLLGMLAFLPERSFVEAARDPLDRVQELERAERLAEEGIGVARRRLFLARALRSGEKDDADVGRHGIFLQLPAQSQPVHARQADVEDDDVRRPARDLVLRFLGGPGLVDLDVHHLEGRAEEDAQRGVVVDHEQPQPSLVETGHRPNPLDMDRVGIEFEDLGAVLAGELRCVERDVGLAQEIVRLSRMIGERRDARGSSRQRAPAPPLRESVPHPIGDLNGRRRGSLDHERELLASDPEDLVVRAHDPHQDAPDRAQNVVPGEVPFAVVDLLEVVEIDDDEGDPRSLGRRVAQHLPEVLVERALVREAGQRVAPSLGVRQREPALVRERLRGEVGDSRDELRVTERLDARRKRHENGSEGLCVGDHRNRNRLGAGRAEPVELAQLVRVRFNEAELRVRAGNDVRRRAQRLGRARPGQGGKRKRAFGRCEVDRRERRAGEVGELARDEVGRAAAARRAGDRVSQPDERLARPCEGALELPQRSALQAVRVGARLEHRHHVDDVVRSSKGDDPGPRQQVADPLRRLDAV